MCKTKKNKIKRVGDEDEKNIIVKKCFKYLIKGKVKEVGKRI